MFFKFGNRLPNKKSRTSYGPLSLILLIRERISEIPKMIQAINIVIGCPPKLYG